MSLDGLSLMSLIKELNSKLTGGRIDKIFQPDKNTLLFWVRQPGENIKLFISITPEIACMNLTQQELENPPAPPVFCMLLRKHLEDGRIAGIYQYGMDRLATIEIDVRGDGGLICTKTLIVELMGKHSNIILLSNNTIIDSIKRINSSISRFRQVLPGRLYTFPPGQERINLLKAMPAQVIESLKCHKGSLTKAIINTYTGIGPLTAKEIIWRAKLPADPLVEQLTEPDYSALNTSIMDIVKPLAEGHCQPTVVLNDINSRLIGIAAFRPDHMSGYSIHRFATMSEALDFYVTYKKPYNPEKEPLKKIIINELNRLSRKEETLALEMDQANQADKYKIYADILMAHLPSVPSNSNKVALPDLYSDEPEKIPIIIPLDPLLTPLENAQMFYVKYNKLKRGQLSISDQLFQCKQELSYLDSILVSLEYAETTKEVNEITQELAASGYVRELKKRRPEPPSSPLTAITTDGCIVSIGKNNRQNDLLTFKQSHPDDIWLHTKNVPGSHVILRTGSGQVSPGSLLEAAHLAAYYSKARLSANVPVDYTKRRYVKKPSGAKPGFVIYNHHSTIYVTPDAELVKQLIKPNK